MSSIARDTSENSVTFSLAELAKLEEERMRSEETHRAQTRERQAREHRETEARKRAAEAERIAADDAARARRSREEAEEKARIEARQQATLQVARIEAEAKARIDAENAERAHELAVIRARAEGRSGRLTYALGALLGLALCAGAAGALKTSQHIASLEQDAERLRDGQATLVRERERGSLGARSALRRAALQPLHPRGRGDPRDGGGGPERRRREGPRHRPAARVR
jgi:colicin import membrane protein